MARAAGIRAKRAAFRLLKKRDWTERYRPAEGFSGGYTVGIKDPSG